MADIKTPMKTYRYTIKLFEIKDDWTVLKRWRLPCVVADIGDEDLILRRPWFREADPDIRWPSDE